MNKEEKTTPELFIGNFFFIKIFTIIKFMCLAQHEQRQKKKK